MSDRSERELERRARDGDAEAAEQLYWGLMRTTDGSRVMDRLIESAIRLETQQTNAPSVWQKIAFMRGDPIVAPDPAALARQRERWTSISVSAALHRIPREVRQAGFTTYCQQDQCVYRFGTDGQWARVAQLSAAPPGHPFHVVNTLQERDALEVGPREGCLVLANRGVYRSAIRTNKFSSSRRVHWESIRIERGP